MIQKNVKVVRGFKLPAKEGSYYRIICMTGDNKGLSYYLNGKRVVMGRGNTADIQVMDTKSSREHAELKMIDNHYIITDLGSQNGVTVNDLKIKQHKLKSGDKIIIGQTVFKYDFIASNNLTLIKSENSSDNNSDSDVDDEELTQDEIEVKEKEKKRIIILFAILAVVYFMMDSSDSPQKEKREVLKADTVEKDTFAEALRKQEAEINQEQKEKLQTIIHRGLRELREFNYSRAIEEFNLALILSPNNSRASFYLSKAEQGLFKQVEQNMIKAKREQEALKFNAAVVSYCSVIRLLRKYPNEEEYKDAEVEIRKLEAKLGMLEGEINCLSSGEF